MALTKVRGSGIDADGQEIILDADTDTTITADTDDQIDFKTGGSDRMHLVAEKLGVGTSSPNAKLSVSGTGTVDLGIGSTNAGGAYLYLDGDSNGDFSGSDYSYIGHDTSGQLLIHQDSPSGSDNIIFRTNATERMRIDVNGILTVGTTDTNPGNNTSGEGIALNGNGAAAFARNQDEVLILNRMGNDGTVLLIRQAGNSEGSIAVSGSTVSFDGFVGRHESSGIETSVAKGTVVSTIDELDTYPTGTAKEGQTRADHAKVKVSDAVGDSSVYGVVDTYTDDDKVMVASVGISSVRVTGKCAKGDLLESNGDGTAKVQDDDIVRSKTIGKVTIGNSNTDEKLVSCVLYCG